MSGSLPASGVVRVVPYDEVWPRRFRAEAGRIRTTLGELALSIDHIGSTAVPGLASHPIIDISVPVAHLDPEAAYREPLEGLGYVYCHTGEPPKERRIFRLNWLSTRMSELRVVLAGSREEQQLIAFRDALRSDPRAGYAGVKRALAVRFPNDCALYSLAKSAFIQDVLAREFPPR